MLGGRVDMNLGAGATLLPLIRENTIKALAVTSPARSPELPDVPTMIECGLASLTTVTHYGLFGPAGIPADVVARTAKSTKLSKRLKFARAFEAPASNRPAARRTILRR
jgi:tripartite-type tricarboxylate transporter receptor subunit TctC